MRAFLFILLAGLPCSGLRAQEKEKKPARKEGIASYYHDRFEGRRTASGEIFHHEAMTAASNHYPLGSLVRVTHKKSGKSVIVRINDRMGHQGRLIDLTRQAARELCFLDQGVCTVVVEGTDGEFREVLSVPADTTGAEEK